MKCPECGQKIKTKTREGSTAWYDCENCGCVCSETFASHTRLKLIVILLAVFAVIAYFAAISSTPEEPTEEQLIRNAGECLAYYGSKGKSFAEIINTCNDELDRLPQP